MRKWAGPRIRGRPTLRSPIRVGYLHRGGCVLEKRGTDYFVSGTHVNGAEWSRPATGLEVVLFVEIRRLRRKLDSA